MIREQKNSLYSITGYFIGRNAAEGVIILAVVALFAGAEGWLSSQIWTLGQYGAFIMLHVALGLITMAQSLTISAAFMGNVSASVYGATAVITPFIAINMVAVVRTPENNTWINRFAQSISHVYYTYVGSMALSFGAEGRCSESAICGPMISHQKWPALFATQFGDLKQKNFFVEFMKGFERLFGFIPFEGCDSNGKLAGNWSPSHVIDFYELKNWNWTHSMGILTFITGLMFIGSYYAIKYRFQTINL